LSFAGVKNGCRTLLYGGLQAFFGQQIRFLAHSASRRIFFGAGFLFFHISGAL
jgi:hypothetical protein